MGWEETVITGVFLNNPGKPVSNFSTICTSTLSDVSQNYYF